MHLSVYSGVLHERAGRGNKRSFRAAQEALIFIYSYLFIAHRANYRPYGRFASASGGNTSDNTTQMAPCPISSLLRCPTPSASLAPLFLHSRWKGSPRDGLRVHEAVALLKEEPRLPDSGKRRLDANDGMRDTNVSATSILSAPVLAGGSFVWTLLISNSRVCHPTSPWARMDLGRHRRYTQQNPARSLKLTRSRLPEGVVRPQLGCRGRRRRVTTVFCYVLATLASGTASGSGPWRMQSKRIRRASKTRDLCEQRTGSGGSHCCWELLHCELGAEEAMHEDYREGFEWGLSVDAVRVLMQWGVSMPIF